MITIEIVVSIELSSALSLSRQVLNRVLRFLSEKRYVLGAHKLPSFPNILDGMLRDKLINRIGSGFELILALFFPYVFPSHFFIRWASDMYIPKEIQESRHGHKPAPGAWISEVGSILPRIYLVSS